MEDKLQTVAITLWWAEGSKSRRDVRWKSAVNYPVEVTNTNPAIIRLFLDFLRKGLEIDESRIRVQIQIHEGDNKLELEKYWSNITGIPRDNFNKTIVRPIGNKAGKTKGTCKVRFSDKQTYLKLKQILIETLEGIYDKPKEVLTIYEPGRTEVNLLK